MSEESENSASQKPSEAEDLADGSRTAIIAAFFANLGIALITWVTALVVQVAPTDEDVIEAADLGIEGIGTGTVGDGA